MNTTDRRLQQRRAEDKLFNFRPLFFAAIFLCLGIYVSYMQRFNDLSPVWVLLLIPVAIFPFLFCRTAAKAKKTAASVALLGAMLLTGMLAFHVQIDSYLDRGEYKGDYTVSGTVIDATKGTSSYRVVLSDVLIGTTVEKGKLVAYLPVYYADRIGVSDEVVLTGYVVSQKPFDENEKFNVYAVGDDIRFTMRADEGMTIGYQFDLFRFIKGSLQNAVYSGMDDTSAAVTMAVLTGDTQGIDGELLGTMRMGGIAHVFAVSGLHIGSLFAFSLFAVNQIKPLKRSKIRSFVFVAAVLLFYEGVCGYTASVVRAIVSCLILYAGKLTGLVTDFLETLAAAAIVVLLHTPTNLFEVGFQLSFAACLGIGLLSRPIRELLEYLYGKIDYIFTKNGRGPRLPDGNTRPLTVWERIVRGSISFLSVTVGAQLATAPITLAAFGYLSGWSLLLNCIFVPIVSGAFAMLLALAAIATLLPFAAGVLLYLPSVIWSALLIVFETVDLSQFCIRNVSLPTGGFICYYLALTFLSDKWNISRENRYLTSAALAAACVVCMTGI